MSLPLSLSDSISQVKGVGPSTQSKLLRLNIATVGDLLKHFPDHYLDFTKQTAIKDIQVGQPASFLAHLSNLKTFYTRTQKIVTQATAKDETGQITLTWFNNPYLKHLITEGHLYSLAGKPSLFGSILTVIAPMVEEGNSFGLNTKGLVPVYPQTAGLTSRWLRKKIFEILSQVKFSDPLNSAIRQKNSLLSLDEAVWQIHFPQSRSQRWQADKRLSYNEHLRINLENRLEHLKLGDSISLTTQTEPDHLTQQKLPWSLTEDQSKTVAKIYRDLRQRDFTHRLIQGETGSGKTIPLVFAANQCLSQGLSCAILAPTAVLATQHLETFRQYCLYPDQISLVTTQSKPSLRSEPTLYIGTQALFTKLKPTLKPPLAFVAIDEQHKFGVDQRNLLLQRSPVPHLFNLSATPIPRTVALGLLGDVQVSTFKHKPINRQPSKTYVLSPARFKNSPPWLINELHRGNQIFVVCPNITSHSSEISSVEAMARTYRKMLPARFPLWSIHGRLSSSEQQDIIARFKKTRSSVLIATSLIEVGIDIPEANIMIVHSAERFGLAQLHQLRGRVGRGDAPGHCFLVSSNEDGVEIERLQLLKKYHSGLVLAKKDLRLRGAGEIFGLKQHGTLPTKLKHFWSRKLFIQAKSEAFTLVQSQPSRASLIARRLITW